MLGIFGDLEIFGVSTEASSGFSSSEVNYYSVTGFCIEKAYNFSFFTAGRQSLVINFFSAMLIILSSGDESWLGWSGLGRDSLGWLVGQSLPGPGGGLPLCQEGQGGGGREGRRCQAKGSTNICCVRTLQQVPHKVRGPWPSLVTDYCWCLEA